MADIEQKQSKIEECQKYSEQYAVGVKVSTVELLSVYHVIISVLFRNRLYVMLGAI